MARPAPEQVFFIPIDPPGARGPSGDCIECWSLRQCFKRAESAPKCPAHGGSVSDRPTGVKTRYRKRLDDPPGEPTDED